CTLCTISRFRKIKYRLCPGREMITGLAYRNSPLTISTIESVDVSASNDSCAIGKGRSLVLWVEKRGEIRLNVSDVSTDLDSFVRKQVPPARQLLHVPRQVSIDERVNSIRLARIVDLRIRPECGSQ